MEDDDSLPLTQDADGHWRWVAADEAESALVAFATRADALADWLHHRDAALDASGRRVMPKEHLRKMISAVALRCEQCADVYFGGVYWHRRDTEGANWGVAIMSGAGDHDGCLRCVHAVREALRRRYSIIDEA